MRRVALALAGLAALGCSETLIVYHRTGPRRVEVQKRASPTSLLASAVHGAPGAVEVHVKRSSRVTLRRVLHYNATALVYGHSGNFLNEMGETFLGVMMLSMAGAFWDVGDRLDGPDTSTRKTVRKRRFFLALLDPTTSVFTNNMRTEPVVKEDVFQDPPVVREYEVRLPAAKTAIEYRVLDEGANELARGSATTDLHGEVVVEGLPDRAIAVEVTADRQTVVAPILARVTPAPGDAGGAEGGSRGLVRIPGETVAGDPAPATQPVSPAPIAVAAAAEPTRVVRAGLAGRLANEAVADVAQPLPHVALTMDLASLMLNVPEYRFCADVRLFRWLSLTPMFAYQTFSYMSGFVVETQKSYDFGAQLRLYVVGNFRKGLYVGGEGDYTYVDVDPTPIHLREFKGGPFLGYKYTFDFGMTLNVSFGYRYEHIDYGADDPDPPLVEWDTFGHFDVGWSL